MSDRRMRLDAKPVVAIVLVLLAVVAALNVRTFGGARKGAQRVAARVQSYPVPPSDLERVLRQAMSEGTAAAAADPERRLPALGRDPFLARPLPVSPASATAATAAVAAAGPLRCAAVMLGGLRPTALIDGRACLEGETVAGWLIGTIAPDGVHLIAADGGTRFLPVGRASAAAGAALVTRSAPADVSSRSRLLVDTEAERKIP